MLTHMLQGVIQLIHEAHAAEEDDEQNGLQSCWDIFEMMPWCEEKGCQRSGLGEKAFTRPGPVYTVAFFIQCDFFVAESFSVCWSGEIGDGPAE